MNGPRWWPSADCEVLVWLTAANAEARARRHESATEGITAALVAAVAARHVVVVSSALVYGAYANNPVPLTEDAALRPDVQFAFARQLGAVEQLVDEWRLASPERTVTVLRPVLVMAADGTGPMARALAAGMGQRAGEDDPPAQFLHLDDLTSRRGAGRRARARRGVQRRPRRLGARRAGARPVGRGAADQAARNGWRRSPPACAGGSSAVRSRRACAATPAGRGWWPTTGSRPRAGRPR